LTACSTKKCGVCEKEVKTPNKYEFEDETVWMCDECYTAFETLEQVGVKVDNAKELVDALKK
jgi:hypothetical protein